MMMKMIMVAKMMEKMVLVMKMMVVTIQSKR